MRRIAIIGGGFAGSIAARIRAKRLPVGKSCSRRNSTTRSTSVSEPGWEVLLIRKESDATCNPVPG